MATETEILERISECINRYASPLIFILGTVGNMLNCLVLSQRHFRSNPCAFLFLISSLAGLICIIIGLSTRIMAGWSHDPTTTIDWICKFRAFIVFTTRTLATWLITLATIDRWLLSSIDIHRRQRSSLRNARIGTLVSVILSVCSYIHMIFCYEANQVDQPLKCYGGTVQCRLATDLTYALITLVIPLVLMTIFGLLTMSNIRQVQSRVHTVQLNLVNRYHEKPGTHPTIPEENQSKRNNHHLLRMLIVQIICLVIFCLPQAIQKFHISFQPFGSGTELEDEIKKFLYNLEVILAFVAAGMPFYIYTLAGGVMFRKGVMNLVQTLKHRFFCL